ncbi:hypothetical protein [uncultured Martelella sp.]|nr:hypothetical protein [uncultured Martelella sp.]
MKITNQFDRRDDRAFHPPSQQLALALHTWRALPREQASMHIIRAA